MKILFRYLILLLAGGIIIPIYQLTCPINSGQVIKPDMAHPNAIPCPENQPSGFSFKDDVAAKLIPVLKYF